jgi:hypothetical protein
VSRAIWPPPTNSNFANQDLLLLVLLQQILDFAQGGRLAGADDGRQHDQLAIVDRQFQFP